MSYRYKKSGSIASLAQDAQCLTGIKTIGAGAFAEDEILMPNMPEGILPGIIRVDVETELGDYLDAAGDKVSWSLSGKSQDAVLKCGDSDCILNSQVEAQTASLTGAIELCFSKEPPAPLKVSYRKLYMQFNCTFAADVHYRIWWVPRSSPTPQRDNLVSQTQF